MLKNVLLGSCFVFLCFLGLAQTRYLGGTAALSQTSNTANSGLFQSNTTKSSSILILPEYGIINERGNMFGLTLGFYLSRTNIQGNINNLVAGVLGVSYRKFFNEGQFRPFLETGLLGYVGQFNPGSQGAEYFQGNVPLKAGLMYRLNDRWHVLGSLEVLGLNYTRSGGLSATQFFLANRGNVALSVVRLF
jgi:hypothetical protein